MSREGEVLWRYDRSNAGLQSVSRGVWWTPATGGDATQVASFDDPAMTVYGGLTVGPEHLYLTIVEYESDIWVMDLRSPSLLVVSIAVPNSLL